MLSPRIRTYCFIVTECANRMKDFGVESFVLNIIHKRLKFKTLLTGFLGCIYVLKGHSLTINITLSLWLTIGWCFSWEWLTVWLFGFYCALFIKIFCFRCFCFAMSNMKKTGFAVLWFGCLLSAVFRLTGRESVRDFW